jgi:uncharacterized protein with NAD-binding domain and iron-sulfur cluster
MSKPERKLEGKRKVAVIGAGPSGLAAAYGLSLPEARDQFDVHVYQMGWRAGGKASTGRNADKHNRVEQNGSHYLFGCYHNCFELARQAYDELGPEAGFGTLADNFTPCSVLVGSARAGRESEPSFIFFPTNLALPGTGAKYAQPFDYLLMLFQLWLSFVLGIFNHGDDPTAASRFVGALFPLCPFQEKALGRRIWGKLMRALLFLPALLVNRVLFPLLRGVVKVLVFVSFTRLDEVRKRELRRWLVARLGWLAGAARDAARRFCDGLRTWFARQGVGWGWGARVERMAILAELSTSVGVGIMAEQLWRPGNLEAIDREDFREWLGRHGCREGARQSVFVKCWYDAVIAYQEGDPDKPRMSAAVALHAIYRAFFTYKGNFAYQMVHEMGDAWVAPIVQALINRGVKFHFFHRVWDLLPGRDPEGRPVLDGIVLERQLADTQGHDLFTTLKGGRKVWPRRPTFGGESRLDLAQLGLDDFYGHDSGDRRTLVRGQDFDDVVCTIPADALPHQAPSCFAAEKKWRTMVDNVDSADSVSLRIWFAWKLQQLGWPFPEPILSGFSWPFSTWEDNGQSLGHEDFPADNRPQAIATVFGSLKAAKKPLPRGPEADREVLRQQAHAVRYARRFMATQAGGLWPGLYASDGALRYQAFYTSSHSPVSDPSPPAPDAPPPDERARARWQLLRANVGPLERYVLALPGTLQYRLRADETGFRNLVFAGDWTRNGLEVGCAEGAVMSGLQAARALCDHPTEIIGEHELEFGMFASALQPRREWEREETQDE